jgi:haloalkane dehalogenase
MNENTHPALPPSVAQLYPFKPHYHTTSWGQMHYVDHGEGMPVVLLHGNPTWSFLYRDLITLLASRDQEQQALEASKASKPQPSFRCIAPDHLGCGLSDKPQTGFGYTLAEHIDNVVGLLVEKLDLKAFHLVVHDWGGAIGMGVAARLKERVHKLVVMNTAAFAFDWIPRRIAVCKTPVLGEWLVRRGNAFARAAQMQCTVKPLPEAVRAGFIHPYHDWQSRIAVHRFVKDIPLDEHHPSWQQLKAVEAGLEQLRSHPMQLHWGLRDWCFTPAFLKEWKQRFPAAKAHEYPEAGHYVLEDAPQAMPVIRDFLSA